ncbi:uncharacterized protein OCT59_008655 [Rhizophagus irregularis]|uniref:uncharacterized protein n=1 Tax=Rhizophagus irregularis TaxID=588596 RepID=UPI003330CB0B|nr:hypothetical protein OCT59_008655 [Rhizophagus irregularis]
MEIGQVYNKFLANVWHIPPLRPVPRRIPLGGISPMAAPDSEIEKLTNLFICGYHDDWMEKFSSTLKSWQRVKDQSRNPKGFGFAEYAVYCVLYALHVLGGEGSGDDKKVNIKADENTRKYLAQYEASRPGTVRAAARERERQREEEERANRRAEAEKERERSHRRENRERTEKDRRWQHREETMATNREREAERDLNVREKQNSRSGNNGEKVSGMGR